MKVLVTGGAGFIGSHLVDHLVEKNYQVSVLDIVPKREALKKNLLLHGNEVMYIQGDVCNQETVRKAMMGVESVVHLAAKTSVTESRKLPREYYKTNLEGTINVMDAALSRFAKNVVLASSAAVYGNAPVQEEGFEGQRTSIYAATKYAAEDVIRVLANNDTKGVSLRFFNVYGPRQDEQSPYAAVISKFIDALQRKRTPTIYGDGEQVRDFVHVNDVVQACVLAMHSKTSGTYNIGTGIPTSVNSIFKQICQLLHEKIEPKYVEARPEEIRTSCANINRAKEYLGFNPKMTLEAGLPNTVEFYLH